MKKLLVALAAVVALAGCREFTQYDESIQLLVVKEGENQGACTTWSVNKERGVWATAQHCLGGETLTYFIDGQEAFPFKLGKEGSDLALLRGVKRPALKVSNTAPKVGERVFIVGHYWGHRLKMVIFGEMKEVREYDKPVAGLWKRNTVFIVPANRFPGMSGSPILNAHGLVVSVDQGYGKADTLGAVWSDLKDLVNGYEEG